MQMIPRMSMKSASCVLSSHDVKLLLCLFMEELMTKGNRMAKSIFKEAIEWVLIIAAAVAVAYLIDHFLIVNATVPSSSMEKTIMTGDRVIGNRLAYLKVIRSAVT